MATTPEGRRLTAQHQRAQQANQASFLEEFLAAWALLDIANLDLSTPPWLRVITRLIEAFRQNSADLAWEFARRLRELELPDTDIMLPEIEFFDGPGPEIVFDLGPRARRVPRRRPGRPPSRIPLRPNRNGKLVINWRERDPRVEATLRVTGPIEVKRRIKLGEPPERAWRNAAAQAGGAAIRHVADGGRDTMLTLVQNDRAALGWIRVTRPNCCSFCAMLASRGPVYKQETVGTNVRGPRNQNAGMPFDGPGDFKVHDNCKCTAIPVYSRTADWPGRGREFQQMWNDHIRGRYSGKDALNAWRRLYERPELFIQKTEETKRPRRRAA